MAMKGVNMSADLCRTASAEKPDTIKTGCSKLRKPWKIRKMGGSCSTNGKRWEINTQFYPGTLKRRHLL
jgi:hypothetical protein